MKLFSAIILLIFSAPFSILLSSQAFAQSHKERPLHIIGQIIPYQLQAGQSASLELQLQLDNKYRAYSDKFEIKSLESEVINIGALTFAPLKEFFDENTKKKKMGVIGQARAKATIEIPSHGLEGLQKIKFSLRYQACTKTYCLFPIDETFEVPVQISAVVAVAAPTTTAATTTAVLTAAPAAEISFLKSKFEDIEKQGLLWTLLFVFIAGVLTSFTPCIFPMIPITLSILGQQAHIRSRKHQLLIAHIYVLGIAVTYSALGVFAAATGSMFGSFMSHPAVLSVIVIVFLAMAFSMFGLYELQAPAFIRNRLGGDLQVSGYHGVFIYGIIAGVVASPCVGPVLVGILTSIARTQNLWLGFWMMFVFALGFGQLFILIGVFGSFTKHLPKSGPWMDAVKNIFGTMMVGAALYYLSFIIPTNWWPVAVSLTSITLASYLGAFNKISTGHHASGAGSTTTQQKHLFIARVWKGFCQAILIVSSVFLGAHLYKNISASTGATNSAISDGSHATGFIPYTEDAFQTAIKNHRPIIIDFGASWCGACVELEEKTFPHEAVQALVSQFVMLKFDATSDSPALDIMKKKYNIVGLPTVVFYDSSGAWRKDLTVNEFISGPEFAEKMKQAR